MTTDIVPAASRGIDVISRIGEFNQIAKVFAASGLFTDVRSEAQCFVKILAGAELGIPPFTAMNSFHIIKGKVAMTANAIAARVKASGRYDYRVIEKLLDKCVIAFLEHGKQVHIETWDAKRAQRAGTQNMDKFPDAMLFARAITAGARAVCPDIVGQFCVPEELGMEVNEEGEVLGSYTVTPTPQPTPESVGSAAKSEPPVITPKTDPLDRNGAAESVLDDKPEPQPKADPKVRLSAHRDEAIAMVDRLSQAGFEAEAGKLEQLIRNANIALERNQSASTMHSQATMLAAKVTEYTALITLQTA